MPRTVPVWRIRDRRTFETLRRHGRRVRRGPILVTYVPADRGAPARVAYAIGRRVGSAVARNRVRRRLRAVVRGLDLAPGAYLIAAGPDALTADSTDLTEWAATATHDAMHRPVDRPLEGDER
ncbi:MAG: ribonuclease P protein component [Acidimicrobiales bacterium]